MRVRPTLITIAALAVASLVTALPGSAVAAGGGDGRPGSAPCGRLDRLVVPGAAHQEAACLTDLTTAGTTGTPYTDPADWAGLHAAGTVNPTGVPGAQLDGYFPDTSTSNGNHGWNHDSQFVIRLPDSWNGKLVVTGAPGVREQYATDFVISDWVLAKGYAYAATDKGNGGTSFYKDGQQPGDAILEWHERVTELTKAAKAVVAQRYGRSPARTYMTGISNGGYLTRWQLEHNPQLFDGGVDWEGTLFRSEGPNLFTYLPTALRSYPAYAAGDEAAHRAMLAAGFEPGSEFLWPFHYGYYWDVTQRTYREELDPAYDGDQEAGTPFCASGTPGCDADYDYLARPQAVHDAVARVSLTGRIGKPMITLHGTYDALLPIRTDSDVYDRLVADAGRSSLHRYYRFEAGNHVDGLYSAFPDRLRPLLPCDRSAFAALEAWVEDGVAPPADATLPRPGSGDIVNSCSLS